MRNQRDARRQVTRGLEGCSAWKLGIKLGIAFKANLLGLLSVVAAFSITGTATLKQVVCAEAAGSEHCRLYKRIYDIRIGKGPSQQKSVQVQNPASCIAGPSEVRG